MQVIFQEVRSFADDQLVLGSCGVLKGVVRFQQALRQRTRVSTCLKTVVGSDAVERDSRRRRAIQYRDCLRGKETWSAYSSRSTSFYQRLTIGISRRWWEDTVERALSLVSFTSSLHGCFKKLWLIARGGDQWARLQHRADGYSALSTAKPYCAGSRMPLWKLASARREEGRKE